MGPLRRRSSTTPVVCVSVSRVHGCGLTAAANDGIIVVADRGNNCIRAIKNGLVTTVAGSPVAGFADGEADRGARFNVIRSAQRNG